MKSDCTLIATIPSLANLVKVEEVFATSYVSELRFNTGVHSPYSAHETLEILNNLSKKYSKKLWIDIKGRQLRVAKWADPLYSCIELNHKIQLLYPAQIFFRNGSTVNIIHVKDGNKLFVDPLPKEALGAGQSVNILARELVIEGYLTEQDKEYLYACKNLGIKYVMASYVESYYDLSAIHSILPTAEIVSKIESPTGVNFICENNLPNLMAARDDLFIECKQNYNSMMIVLKKIIQKDSGAICASKIFSSLERRENADFADFADLELMYNMGYRKFMLCDNICNYAFEQAINEWRIFINE